MILKNKYFIRADSQCDGGNVNELGEEKIGRINCEKLASRISIALIQLLQKTTIQLEQLQETMKQIEAFKAELKLET